MTHNTHEFERIRYELPELLESFSLELIAITVRTSREGINASMDLQGQRRALTTALALHHIGHSHARVQHGIPVDPQGLRAIREEAKSTLPEIP